MTWTQNLSPAAPWLSFLMAALPVLFIFWALILKRMRGHYASLLTLMVALLVAVFFFGMPMPLAVLSVLHGMFYGLFPIGWIVVAAMFLFNLTVRAGKFEVIRQFMAGITPDRRLQALLIAFAFGAFLEGTAGFGAPVAISAARRVGLGFNPLYAAAICLIANTAPVAFGSIGIPIVVASQVSGVPEDAIAMMVGRTLPLLAVVLPLYLVVIMSGWKRALEVGPAVGIAGLVFAFFQWFTSNYLGPMLPDIVASLATIIALLILFRFWKPAAVWRFPDEPDSSTMVAGSVPRAELLRALSPFLLLVLIVLTWGIRPVKELMDGMAMWKISFPGLDGMIITPKGDALAQVFKLNILSASGTAVFIAALLSTPWLGVRPAAVGGVLWDTLVQLKNPLITISSVLGFAYLVNNSGMSLTMASVIAGSGAWFALLSPVIGWLGVFITGSDTSSNALFGKVQHDAALATGMPPVVAVGANVSGGVVGKMISPQSVAVAAAAGGLPGREADLFRFTVLHSFLMLAVICLITLLQVWLAAWVVPG
ncbi:MAG: L-lactate permease [Bacteroidota bacterium]